MTPLITRHARRPHATSPRFRAGIDAGAHATDATGLDDGHGTPLDAPAIAAHGLDVHRGERHVLHDLTFDVPRGQITGLLGPSGCGKSTVMRAIVGVQAGVDGELTVLGEAPGSPRNRERVGYVTQAASVYDDLTVAENLRFFASVLDSRADDVDRALGAVDLDERRDQLVRDMSGGQRSRVSLAVALLHRPDLLVLDEPTVGLDPVLRRDLWAMFADLAEAGTTILVSSHVMDEADHCDRLLLMRDGVLIADSTPERLRADTGCETIEDAFLAMVQPAGASHPGADDGSPTRPAGWGNRR